MPRKHHFSPVLTGADKCYPQSRTKIKVGNLCAGLVNEADFCGGDAAANDKPCCGHAKRRYHADGLLFLMLGDWTTRIVTLADGTEHRSMCYLLAQTR